MSGGIFGGLFLIVIVVLSFWGYFGSLAKKEKPSDDESNVVVSVSVFFIAPFVSCAVVFLFLGPTPGKEHPVAVFFLWAAIWYVLYKLIFFLANKVDRQ